MTAHTLSPALTALRLVLGPPKSASTWTYDALAADAGIRIGRSKEIRFFSDHHGRALGWYAEQFRSGPAELPLVDVCHDYLHDPAAPARVAALVETGVDVGVVVVLRDPVARTWSDYHDRRRQGRYRFDYPTALERDPELLANSTSSVAVEAWLDALGPDRVSVLWFEDLVADPGGFWLELHRSLGVPAPSEPPAAVFQRSNPARASRAPGVTRVLRAVGKVLQRHGLHQVTHTVKRSSLTQRLLYRPRDGASPVEAGARRAEGDARVRAALAADVDRLAALVGRRPEGWLR